jgi:DNA-binding NtrC family response regulator
MTEIATSYRPAYRPASREATAAYLLKVLPGQSSGVSRLRAQFAEFARDPLANRLLLTGSFGTGKSALARDAAFLKAIAPMTAERANELVSGAQMGPYGELHALNMMWFVELALTGLVEDLAAVQLFGSVKGAFTNAINRSGIFVRAATAHGASVVPAGAIVTGGVVFLDEIGDLPLILQPQLLPVLSGGTFYPVGGEGQPEHAHSFHGVVISATWRNLAENDFRPDLLSRIAGTVINVPGLVDRLADFELIVDGIQEMVRADVKARIDRMRSADSESVHKDGLDHYEASIHPVSPEARRKLTKVDWDRHGNLRGLRRAVEAAMSGSRHIDEIISELPVVQPENTVADPGPLLLRRLLAQPAKRAGLVGHVRETEHVARAALQNLLKDDEVAVTRLAAKLGISERDLKEQAHQLPRRRRQ